MKRLLLLTLLAAPLCHADSPAARQPDPKAARVAELIRVKHLREDFQERLVKGRADYEARANKLMTAEQARFSPRPDFERQFQAIHARFVSTIETPMAVDAYMQVVTQYYREHYTEADLDGLIRFYSSPLGQKELAVMHEADVGMELEFATQSQAIDAAALAEFTAEYHKLAEACQCLNPGPL